MIELSKISKLYSDFRNLICIGFLTISFFAGYNATYHEKFVYNINQSNVKAVNSTKYLGITITSDLNWKEHVDNIVGKANQRLRFIGRTLKRYNRTTKETAYTALVRPFLEYCSKVWDPYQVGLTEDIERVQRRELVSYCRVTGETALRK